MAATVSTTTTTATSTRSRSNTSSSFKSNQNIPTLTRSKKLKVKAEQQKTMAATATVPMMSGLMPPKGPVVMRLSSMEIAAALKQSPVPCFFGLSLLVFMAMEYTLHMVPPDSPPFDLGFYFTTWLHALIAASPALNSLLAALNTVFVGMQAAYIGWTMLVEGRARPTIAALFMFTCRGIMGYSTQLPLPHGFLGSGMDFPVGKVSFFLFFSGHVAGAVIASLDMRRMKRSNMAATFDFLNLLQAVRLLACRGHYTIDLAVGVGAGMLFDSLAGMYEEKRKSTYANKQQGFCQCVGCLN